MDARIWQENVTIPTYGVGEPNRNPMFLEKRVYQGSSGAVYPYPVIDSVEDEKHDKTWRAVFLENEYLRIEVLPELGGRVQRAQDKTNGYDFVYYNRVIKPALVGLAGPWISGGIEFNWPQHHRPSTYMPLDYALSALPNGEVTLWVSEIERMSRLRVVTGFTLRPGSAVLEARTRIENRTDVPQTFLWWANPAVAVNDDYQSIFPPDVRAVMDHGKRDVSRFPIADGVYYKIDYSPGTDISWYRNISVPTSYMAYKSDYDFLGGYDHGKRAGLLHVADHHISPGKKQWTWGNGDFGKAWDRQLTDDDGPYVELMCGVYTDNQPDFSWLMPGEGREFSQFFLPYKDLGVVKNASTLAAVSLDIAAGVARTGAYVTSPYKAVSITLSAKGEVVFEETLPLDPEHGWTRDVPIPADASETDLNFALSADGEELMAYAPSAMCDYGIPCPAQPVRPPEEITSNEELYLAGLHLEQYRHATYAPVPYYEEALLRDPGDARCHNALGLLCYRRGKFAEAESHFRAAVQRLTSLNPNPYDGEPYYNLGLSLVMQGRDAEAMDAFGKAAWNAAWRGPAHFAMVRMAGRRGDWEAAMQQCVEQAKASGSAREGRSVVLAAALRRRIGKLANAEGIGTVAGDLSLGALWERYLAACAAGRAEDTDVRLKDIDERIRPEILTYIEASLDYAHAGMYDDALGLLEHGIGVASRAGNVDAQAWYYLGWYEANRGELEKAGERYREAAAQPPDYCFPHNIESVPVFETAIALNPTDARAHYYLGNFWYSKRQHEDAIRCWEASRSLDAGFPTVHRNLGLAYFNVRQDGCAALASFEEAFRLDPADARVLYELDQLRKRLGHAPGERLAAIEGQPSVVARRDDLTIERIALLNRLGRHGEALSILEARRFHPWEGGEGEVTGQYVLALVQIARRRIDTHRFSDALTTLKRALSYPDNLGEGKLPGAADNAIRYWLGIALRGLSREAEACHELEWACTGIAEPNSAVFYNDQPPDSIYYQGLALIELGREDEARRRFESLVDFGDAHLDDDVQIDYFAVSLPDFLVFDDDLNARNQVHCRFMKGLGLLGLGRTDEARTELEAVLAMDPSHQGAWQHLRDEPRTEMSRFTPPASFGLV